MLSAFSGQQAAQDASKMRIKAMEDMQCALHTRIEEKLPHPRNINPDSRKVYVIGSLRNPKVEDCAIALRDTLGNNVTVFDDWMCAGHLADDAWRDHEKNAGFSFLQALERPAAQHVFAFDKYHLNESDAVVLIAPAGKSAHLELGWCLGRGKPGFILLDDPERWDVMYQFATGVTDDFGTLSHWLMETLYADNP